MSKHFSDPTFQAEVPQQRKRGRPPEVDPEKLRRNVIELSFALEENWGEVGGPLREAESIVDIRTALRKIMNPQCRSLEPFTCDQIQEPDTIRNATPAKF